MFDNNEKTALFEKTTTTNPTTTTKVVDKKHTSQ